MRCGDRVIATVDVGGWMNGVAKGTEGVVVDEGGFLRPARVAFTVPGGFFSADEVVTLDVAEDDIARI